MIVFGGPLVAELVNDVVHRRLIFAARPFFVDVMLQALRPCSLH